MTVAQLTWSSSSFTWPKSQGVSKEADFLENIRRELFEKLQESITLGELYEITTNSLYESFKEAEKADWDGYGAEAIQRLTLENALQFINAMPSTLSPPEVIPEPDGEIGFEWFFSPHLQFSVSIGPTRKISYAGLFGTHKIHGEDYFEDEFPEFLVQILHRLLLKASKD